MSQKLRMTTTRDFPILVHFNDYHEISDALELMSKFIPTIRGKEISLDKYGFEFDGVYWGLFWVPGTFPNKAELTAILGKFCNPTDA